MFNLIIFVRCYDFQVGERNNARNQGSLRRCKPQKHLDACKSYGRLLKQVVSIELRTRELMKVPPEHMHPLSVIEAHTNFRIWYSPFLPPEGMKKARQREEVLEPLSWFPTSAISLLSESNQLHMTTRIPQTVKSSWGASCHHSLMKDITRTRNDSKHASPVSSENISKTHRHALRSPQTKSLDASLCHSMIWFLGETKALLSGNRSKTHRHALRSPRTESLDASLRHSMI